jgi:hypothetical protein
VNLNTYLFQVQGHQYSCQFFSLFGENKEKKKNSDTIPGSHSAIDADTFGVRMTASFPMWCVFATLVTTSLY